MGAIVKPWAWYVLAWLGAVTIARTLAPGPRGALGVAIEFSGALAVVAGARLNRPTHPLPWYLIAVALACYSAGDAVVVRAPAGGTPLSDALSDALFLSLYPFIIAALLLFSRGREGGHRTFETIDAGIVASSVGLLGWVYLIEPIWQSAQAVEGGYLLGVCFPIGNLILFCALIRLAHTTGPGQASSLAVATGFGLLLILNAVTLASGGAGPLQVHPQTVDPWWMLAFPLAGTFALHPWMLRFGAPEPRSKPPLHTVQILALAVALLVAPSLLLVQLAANLPLSLVPVLVCSVVLVVLASIRMVLLVRRINTEAATDSLTGLPNRRAFYAAATERLAGRATPRALLLLDLNRFKDVNDALGHLAGDALLIQVAARIRRQVRHQDVLARLGGDEFAILLEDAGLEEAQRAASAIVDALAVPFELDEFAVHSSASIGISLFPEHATELSMLLRRSDIAMYQAKVSGGHATYGGGAEDDNGRALRLAEEFRSALPAQELVLHYQPKLDLATGEVRGVEALVRWNHPAHGLLYPATFLPCVQDAGLMRALTQTVLTLALDQAAGWWANGTRLTVAVNLSASSLSDVDLRREISEMVADRGLPPSALRLEITEEFLMADKTQARIVLGALCDMGISISVDDFGTGYSSLAYLRDLPVDELKLDMSFVSPMSTDPRAAALVASTIGLAHSLGLRMVAEGVEDRATLDELTLLGCDEVQGFFVSRPLPADELDTWLAARAAVARLPHHSRAAGLPTQANPVAVRSRTVP